MKSLNDLAQEWLEAFNQRDLERLLSLYTEDAVHLSPKLQIKKPHTEGRVQGKAALRSWWQESFQNLPTLHYRQKAISCGERRVVLEYVRELKGEEKLAVAEVFETNAQNQIIRSAVYHGIKEFN